MKKDESTDRNDRYRRTIFYWFSGISLFVSIVALCGAYVFKGLVVEKESIVLLFVGFLTTFIVIGNYAQVKSIEQDFSQKVGELKSEFSEKVKELELEFDQKVFANQSFLEIKEIYKRMTDLRRVAEELGRTPYYSDKRKGLIEEGKEYLSIFLTLLLSNKFILPKDMFLLFKEVEESLSTWFNNSIYISSTNENNVLAEEKIQNRLILVLNKTKELEEKIDELFKLKYKIY